jgi:hypothetical protein
MLYIKYEPVKSDKSDAIFIRNECSIIINNCGLAFPNTYREFRNVSEKTNGLVNKAYYENDDLFLSIPRHYQNEDSMEWDVGTYSEIKEIDFNNDVIPETLIEITGTTADEISNEKNEHLRMTIRLEQYARCQAIQWRIDRYRDQIDNGEPTTNSESEYKALLEYKKEIRLIDKQSGFPETVNWPETPV